MYKYKLTIKERSTFKETESESNNLGTLTADLRGCKGISFIIVNQHNHKLMMSGSI